MKTRGMIMIGAIYGIENQGAISLEDVLDAQKKSFKEYISE